MNEDTNVCPKDVFCYVNGLALILKYNLKY